MRDITMTRSAYAKNYFLAVYALYVWYRLLFLRMVKQNGELKSIAMIVVISLVVFGINFSVTHKWYMNDLNFFSSALVPFGVMTFLLCGDNTRRIVRGLIAVLVVAIFFFLVAVINHMREKRSYDRSIESCAKIGYIGSHLIVGVGSVLTMILVLVCTHILKTDIYTYSEHTPQIEIISEGHGDDLEVQQAVKYTILNVWPEGISDQDKLDALDAVKTDQLKKLGVTKEIKLVTADLEGNIGGEYSRSLEYIVIDDEYFRSAPPATMMHCICHECYHVAQLGFTEVYQKLPEEYRELVFFDDASTYCHEVNNYINCNDDTDAYSEQKIERDAEGYAYRAMMEYWGQ